MPEERRRLVGGQGPEHLLSDESPLRVVQVDRPLVNLLYVEAAVGPDLAFEQQVEVCALFSHLVDDFVLLTVTDLEL